MAKENQAFEDAANYVGYVIETGGVNAANAAFVWNHIQTFGADAHPHLQEADAQLAQLVSEGVISLSELEQKMARPAVEAIETAS